MGSQGLLGGGSQGTVLGCLGITVVLQRCVETDFAESAVESGYI